MTVREDPPTTPPCPKCGEPLTASDDHPILPYRCEPCNGYFLGSASEAMRHAVKRSVEQAEAADAQAALIRRREQEA